MNRKKMNKNHVDTHMRIETELRNYLIDTQDFYNSIKDNGKPNISMNTLCNIAILSLKNYLENLSEAEQRRYIIRCMMNLKQKSGV